MNTNVFNNLHPVAFVATYQFAIHLPAGRAEVAVDLNISVYTVDAHRSRIMKKLQLRTSRDLVRFALQRGLI